MTPPVDGDVLQLLLAEIASDNPSFPVRRFYRHLSARKREAEIADAPDVLGTF